MTPNCLELILGSFARGVGGQRSKKPLAASLGWATSFQKRRPLVPSTAWPRCAFTVHRTVRSVATCHGRSRPGA